MYTPKNTYTQKGVEVRGEEERGVRWHSRGVVGMCVHAKKHIHAKKAGKERGEGEERIVRGL